MRADLAAAPDFMIERDSEVRDVVDSRDLISRAALGDDAAFEALLFRHQRMVFGTALRLLRDPDDARDAAQEAFLKLHRHLRSLDPDRAVAAWLYRVTVNACHDVARKRRKAQQHVDLERAGELAANTAQEHPDRKIAASEQRRLLQAALAVLPQKERFVIVLRDVEGLETDEVARVLGISEGTVRSHLSRGRLRLRRLIERLRDAGAPTTASTLSSGRIAWWRRRR